MRAHCRRLLQLTVSDVNEMRVPRHTTMRVSLGLLAVTDSARCCGLVARDADRTAVLIKNGDSLLAMAVVVKGNGEGNCALLAIWSRRR
jgi:hypothetical protein